jgi:hypothetical protein
VRLKHLTTPWGAGSPTNAKLDGKPGKWLWLGPSSVGWWLP